MQSKIIAVDFDGTLCTNKWPDIGEPNRELIDYLKDQQKQGVKLILWTCRSNERLAKAVDWCCDRDLWFDAVNENLPEIISLFGSDTRKIYADEYIDDKAMIFVPMTERTNNGYDVTFVPFNTKEIEEKEYQRIKDCLQGGLCGHE